ncbi:hypothetical protein MRX96_056822 [Rhipicephalus microplus]
MKKIVEKYRVFMATEPVIKKIPRNMANDMDKKGKLPVVLGEEEPMQAKLEEVRTTVTFRVKAPLIAQAGRSFHAYQVYHGSPQKLY